MSIDSEEENNKVIDINSSNLMNRNSIDNFSKLFEGLNIKKSQNNKENSFYFKEDNQDYLDNNWYKKY